MLRNRVIMTLSVLLNESGTLRPGAAELIEELRNTDSSYLILTERSLQNSAEIAADLQKRGLRGVRPEHIYTTSMAAAESIHTYAPAKNKAGYIGSKAIEEALSANEFNIVQEHADWLFIGKDRNTVFTDYGYALKLIAEGAEMIAVDIARLDKGRDAVYPGPGAVVKMLEHASGRKAVMMCFPSHHLLAAAMRHMNALQEETVFVCTDLKTEVTAGKKCGVLTVLAVDGYDQNQGLFDQEIHPDMVISDLRGLYGRN